MRNFGSSSRSRRAVDLSLVDPAGDRLRSGPTDVKRAEARTRLHRLRQGRKGLVEPAFANADHAERVQGLRTQGIEGADPQRARGVVFRHPEFAAHRLNMRAVMERG
jgi:hypothetical protein